MESKLQAISVDSIELDNENPRLAFAKIEKEIEDWTKESISEEIKESFAFNNLLHSIEQYGVMDPIWVHDLGDSKYKVIEGNMRVTALKELIKNKTVSPPGINYTIVKAHVIEKNTSIIDLEAQKAVLQTGKNPWGAFNEAAHIYELFWKHKLSIDEIAKMLGKSVSYVSNSIDNFKIYKEFIEFLRTNNLPIDPNKYSFIADASNSIRQKFFQSKPSRQQYFELITPNQKGITRIPSVSNRGGLKIFSKFVNDKKTLDYFLKNPTVTVDDAYLYFQENKLSMKRTWIYKIPNIANGMHRLSQAERKELLGNSDVKVKLISLSKELKKFFE